MFDFKNYDKNMETSRKSAWESLQKVGLPTKKSEDWRYLSLKNFESKQHNVFEKLEKSPDIGKYLNESMSHLVFINGRLDKSLSNFNGAEIVNNAKDQSTETNPFILINQAFSTEKLTIQVSKNTKQDRPLQILYFTTHDKGNTANIQIDLIMEANSELEIFENFLGETEDYYFNNHVLNITLENGARLKHIKMQDEAENSFHMQNGNVVLKRDSFYQSIVLNFGAQTSRTFFNIDLNEQGANAESYGLYTLRNKQHCENYTVISHNAPHTESDQLYKGILDDESHGVFDGKVIVKKDSQKINSAQLNRNILMSKKAKIDTKPQLEIDADDVKCAHGATIGQISEEEVFYLQTRGISKEKAKAMLGHAFANEILLKIDSEQINKLASDELFDKFMKFNILQGEERE